jgi:DNA mismatch repair protein MutL
LGRIHILSDQVANQIAAGEVVDRPASVVKELLENALDAGAERIVLTVEGGGRKLIRIADDGCGMIRDDALLAFERHATSKLRSADDLLAIRTLGFRGEALPAIGSVARVEMITRAAEQSAGTRLELAGGKILSCEEIGAPPGTTIAVRDLFFNTPARKKFLKSETTELGHVTALVTHYALAHPGKHFELHSSSHALLIAPPVRQPSERIFQIFGQDTLSHLLPLTAEIDLPRTGLPEPPPWKRPDGYESPEPGKVQMTGFVSKPELEKLNRNSIYCFVNRRLVRDRLLLHAVGEAYRNILAPTLFPVVLLFLEMPAEEVDVNVHPAKTEVRFRQPAFLHDFVRDTIRTRLMSGRPAASFLAALSTRPNTTSTLAIPSSPPEPHPTPTSDEWQTAAWQEDEALQNQAETLTLTSPPVSPSPQVLPFTPSPEAGLAGSPSSLLHFPRASHAPFADPATPPPSSPTSGPNHQHAVSPLPQSEEPTLEGLASLKPLGQLRESFILAVNQEGLWIVDQHVAHERILFEKVLRQRKVEHQRLLMPLLIDLLPAQMVTFAAIARELEANGFEVEPFGPRTLAVKAAPAGLEGAALERMLVEVLEQADSVEQSENLEAARTRIAASIACHAAIKVNTPLDPSRMQWLLAELAQTEHPTRCPHGRPIVLRYSWKEIERAFHRT